jgi:hypothetical protein
VTRTIRQLLAGLIAAALLAVAGCGGDDENAPDTTAGTTAAPPAATTPGAGDDRGATTGEDIGGETKAKDQDRSSSSDQRLATDHRDRLRAGAEGGLSAGDVVGVDVRRTSVVVRTKLGRDDAKRASNVCAQMRLYLAQEPSRGSTNTVTVVGGDRAVLTRC